MKSFLVISILLLSVAFCVDINAAATYVGQNAQAKSTGYCAKYVANALEAGGFKFTRQSYAYQYHTNNVLKNLGFKVISRPSTPLKGDMYVQLATTTHKYGHIAMYDGRNWCSDFRQNSDQVYSSDAGERIYYRYG